MSEELVVEIKSLANNYKAYAAGLSAPLLSLTGVIINWGNTGVWNWSDIRIILASIPVGIVTGIATWLTKAGKGTAQIIPGTLPVTSDEVITSEEQTTTMSAIQHEGPGEGTEVRE